MPYEAQTATDNDCVGLVSDLVVHAEIGIDVNASQKQMLLARKRSLLALASLRP